MRLKASIVGSSWKAAESSGDAPIRSPADTNMVFGFVARSWRTYVARYSTPPAAMPAGSAGPIRPDDDVASGGRRFPWKSFSPRIWISVVAARSTARGDGPSPAPAVAGAATSVSAARIAVAAIVAYRLIPFVSPLPYVAVRTIERPGRSLRRS